MANTITLPNGMVLKGVPEGTTQAQIIEKLRLNGYDVSSLEVAQPDTIDIPPEDIEEVITESEAPRAGRGESAIRSARQGLTFGFGDELTSALAALSSYPVLAQQGQLNNRTLGDLYRSGLDIERADIKTGREDFPIQSALAEIGGSLVTGGGIAKGVSSLAPKISSKLSQFARTNPFKSSAAIGAAGAGLFGAGEGEGGVTDRAVSGLKGGTVGFLGGGAGGLIASKLGNLSKKLPLPTSEGLRSKARELYQEASRIGGQLKPTETRNLFKKISQAVKPLIKSQKISTGQATVLEEVDALKDSFVSTIRGTLGKEKGASFEQLRALEKMLGDKAEDNVIALTGKLNSVGNSFKTAQRELRKFIDEVGEDQLEGGKLAFDLKREADKKWSASLKLNEVEKIMTRASLQEQPSTGLRTGFRGILADPNKIRNFTKEELKLMNKAAEIDLVTGGLRNMGGRMFPAMTGVGGLLGSVFNPLTLATVPAAYAISGVARKGANVRQLNKANALARLIEDPQALQAIADPRLVGGAGLSGGIALQQNNNQ